MKKLSEKQRKRSVRKARKRRVRPKQQVKLLAIPDRDHASQHPHKFGSATLRGVSRPVLLLGEGRSPPEILCIDRNRSEVLNFVEETRVAMDAVIDKAPINRKTRRAGRGVVKNYWDYTKIKAITPTVALMVAAEYDRASALLNQRFPAIDLSNWRPAVAAVMQDVGFFDLLEIDNTRKGPAWLEEDRPLRVLRMRSGQLAESVTAGELINDLEGLAGDLTPDSDVDFGRLYGALVEGITNTRHHAYPPDYKFRHNGQWWATGAVDRVSRTISAIIYDQGVTIPHNLPKSWMANGLSQLGLGSLGQDGVAIATAMIVSRSSTWLPHRGLGLAEMEAFMETCGAGRLRILSRHGEYISEVGSPVRNLTHRQEVKGTLIQWDVSV